MKREIITTADGSTTIFLPEWNETYHSRFGAIQEAYHVFIKSGLSILNKQSVSVLEIGFGTGLNTYITFLESINNNLKIDYVGVEAYPISEAEISQLNYPSQLNASKYLDVFDKIHQSAWNEYVTLSSNFTLIKRKQFFNEISDVDCFNIIYFDAFGFNVQPDLWSLEIFIKMYNALKPKGVLVTYACRGPIKRAMIEAGFRIEIIPGPPGKREMLRAFKE